MLISNCPECGSDSTDVDHYDTIGPSWRVQCLSCLFLGPYNTEKDGEDRAVADWNLLSTKLYKVLK